MEMGPAPEERGTRRGRERVERAVERTFDFYLVMQVIRIAVLFAVGAAAVAAFVVGEYGLALIPIGIALVCTVVLAMRSGQ
jgi:hypothetical protein